MAIFTVFFSGTGAHSEKHIHNDYISGELISVLAKNAVGQDILDYIQVDGVGSGNRFEWRKHTKDDTYHKIRGTLGSGIDSNLNHVLNVIRGYEEDKGDYLTRAKNLMRDTQPQKKDSFWSWGTSSAYQHWLQEAKLLSLDLKDSMSMEKANINAERTINPITCVNMVGWSRGGVSCFELANRMSKDPKLCNIPVNIFACDPVPGGTNSLKDYKTLAKNVKSIVCFFAEDESSLGFKARMPRLHKSTKYYTSMIPGRHATLVGNAHTSGASSGGDLLTGPGLITRDFAEKVLVGWGSRLKQGSMLNLTRNNVLDLYQQVMGNSVHFNNMSQHTYTVKDRRPWSSRIGQKRESWFGIPTSRFHFPGINNEYPEAVNRHHSDVLDGNLFAVHGISEAIGSAI